MRHTRWLPLLGLAAALALGTTLSGCGGSASATSPPSSASSVTIRSATILGLGRVLVDGDGYTLYAYMPDHRGPSRCFGMCAHQWPPLVLASGQHAAIAGKGVQASLLGTVRRPNGARQVTYDGWPLYTYINDAQPGQATGQAADMGAWYTVSVGGAVDRNVVRTSS